ncbi:MAG TPA: hypothetical protein VNC78_02305 [Actinomycetota bacterium]|nr:hypothetical protein [Actinomycetota bacterium]
MLHRRVVARTVLVTMLLGACRPDTVALVYRFPQQTTSFEMTASARASWEIQGLGSGSGAYTVKFLVTEEVVETDGPGAVIAVTMEPTEITEEGLPSPGGDIRTFTLQVGEVGEVLQVLEIDGIQAGDLDPETLALIGTYRPPLPRAPVRLGDSWQPARAAGEEPSLQSLVATGHLDELGRDPDGAYGRLTFEGDGPLIWQTRLPQGAATLTGAAHTTTAAMLDLDSGFLRNATTAIQGEFEVRVTPEERAGSPLSGTLRLRLEVELGNVES